MKSTWIRSAAFAAAIGASSALAQTQYALDDAQPNVGLSYGMPADYCWFQSFDTVGWVDSITKVQVMWQPGGIPGGTLARVCVWEDPNDDGDPADAQLVAQGAGLVPNPITLNYTTFHLPVAGLVHGKFFVGAYLTTDGSFPSIALLDYDSPYTLRAWFAVDMPGLFDPSRLSSATYNRIETLGVGIHGVFLLRAEGSGTEPVAYCTPKTNSLGYAPNIAWFGAPSVSAGTGFHLYVTGVLNRSPGILIYSTAGRDALPFGGGTLCLAGRLRRTPVQSSGGHLGIVDASGSYHIDLLQWMLQSGDPTFLPGTVVNAQFYSRDNGFVIPDNIGLTNAVEVTLEP